MKMEKNNSGPLSIKHSIYKERRKGGQDGGTKKSVHFMFEISHILPTILFSIQIPGILGISET